MEWDETNQRSYILSYDRDAATAEDLRFATADLTFTAYANGGKIYIPSLQNSNLNGTFVCWDTTNGNLERSSNCTSSSIRNKENVADITDALDKLGQLRPVSFDWKASVTTTAANGGRSDFGLIAEEVNNVIPELVIWDNGQINGIDYQKLVPFAIKGIQEQQVQIEDLSTELALVSQGLSTIQGFLNATNNLHVDNLTVTGLATIANLKVTGNTEVANITVNGHIISAGDTPTIAAGAAAGEGAITEVLGNDTSGTITITTGTNVTADNLVEVIFKNEFANNPKVILTPNNPSAASLEYYYKQLS